MKIKERVHQQDFENSVTEKRAQLLWKQIIAKYPPGATTDDLSDEDARMLVLLQRRSQPETLTAHGNAELKKMPHQFKPPSDIWAHSVDTQPSYFQQKAQDIEQNPYLKWLVGK